MHERVPVDVIVSAYIAFVMGVVRAIVVPSKRGLLGFVSAMIVALGCGTVAGFLSSELGTPPAFQYSCAAGFGLFGHKVVFALLNISINGPRVDNSTHFDGSITGDVRLNNKGEWSEKHEQRKDVDQH